MDRGVITCKECGHPYSVRIRGDGTYVLPTETGECERCGGAEFTRISENVAGDD